MAMAMFMVSSQVQAKTGVVSQTTSISKGDDEPKISKQEALKLLKEGNARFYSHKAKHIHQTTQTLESLTKGQSPMAVIVGCSDSRVPPEIVFDQGLGDLFVIRTAGNVLADFEDGSIEYAVGHLGTPLVVVMGHESCGAIGAFVQHADDDDVEGHIADIVKSIKSEDEQAEILKDRKDMLHRAVKANVKHGVEHLRHVDSILSKKYEKGEIDIVGAVYDINTGKVEFLD